MALWSQLLVVVVALAAPAFAFHKEWHSFMSQYGRAYETDAEHDARYEIFRRNVAFIDAHNSQAELGLKQHRLSINRFADLTHDEFRARMKLKRRPSIPSNNRLFRLADDNQTIPDSVDWRTTGMVTPVKDQGQCGSCWSFSATGSMEGAHALAASAADPTTRFGNKHLLSFSEQELVDCVDDGTFTCDTGGIYTDAFEFVIANGTVLEKDYKYVNVVDQNPEKCQIRKYRTLKYFSKYVTLVSGDENALKVASSQHPGVSVAIDASSPDFQFYSSGVYKSEQCSSDDLDHAVLVVGYGTDSEHGDYWLVKNSWSPEWGDQGYIRMARNNNNMCGIATYPAYILAPTSIDDQQYVAVM